MVTLTDGGVSCLVKGNGALLLCGEQFGLFLQATDDAVNGIEETLLVHPLLVVAGCDEGCLVADVGDVGTRKTWCLACQLCYFYGLVYLERFQMHHEDFLTFVEVWQVNVNLTVEATGTEQGTVEDVSTVGGCQDDDAAVGAEAVHLGEELVEGALALVVASHGSSFAAGTTDGVNLVDEDDARCFGFCLLEEVAHTAGAHTYEHLHEFGT